MAIRVAMIGHGGVGSIHAAKLEKEPDVRLASVYGPIREEASSFAVTHGIDRVCNSLTEAILDVDAAIICSPSPEHFVQARECLQHRVHTLVELPPCQNAIEAEELAVCARKGGVMLGCAHTSRFLEPYLRVKNAIAQGALGKIQEINYLRCHKLRERSWTDNALLHHAAHPVDLLFFWCGGVEAEGCVALPDVLLPQTVSLLGRLPAGGAVTITVTYVSRIFQTRLMVVGDKHTVETDGFSYVKSDFPELELRRDEQETYEEAIHLQDIQFLRACQSDGNYVSWENTINLLRVIDRFRALGQ
jgi:predicted dehydrogenase